MKVMMKSIYKKYAFRILLTGLVLIFAGKLYAQQTPIYSQYMMNGFLLNPAVAGAEGFTSFNLTAREQWVGFSDAPGTYALSAQTRLTKTNYLGKLFSIKKRLSRRRRKPSGRVGLGTYLFNDRNGSIHRTGFQFTYAYHLFIRNSQLSFGIAGSGFQLRADVSPEDVLDENGDPLLIGSKNSMFIPDASVGVYFTSFAYYVGLSSTQLLQSSIKFGDKTNNNYQMIRHYYLTGGYKFDLRRDYELEPSVLLKTTENLAVQADINIKGYYKTDYWVGLSFRTSGALVAMIGLKYDKYHFGYAYDYSFNALNRNSYGTHELMIGLKLGDNRRRYRWLNRF